MIEITETAEKVIKDLLQDESKSGMSLRMQILGRGPGGFQYAVRFVPEEEQSADDEAVQFDGFKVLIDPETVPNIKDSMLDYKEDDFQRGFLIENPNPVWKDSTAQAVQELLDTKINPGLASHGGFVAMLDYKDDTAYIAFGGGCQGCGLVDVTLKEGVEVAIREALPQVKKVIDTTNHGSGTNPFYNSDGDGSSALS
ncbi:MAG TPA: iron-sulfur cluster assembly accessory protein [Anaerolineales bacterium]|nr:iron-sulfur cluster assembly accessory protein [Anaerolineales bacterium]